VPTARDGELEFVVVLSPPADGMDWAFYSFAAHEADWQRDLSAVVGRFVNLEAARPGPKVETLATMGGVKLWSRHMLEAV
jgi:hypothetical protein